MTKALGGHTHIMVLIDNATRYPEAVALCSTTTSVIAQELSLMFFTVGVPPSDGHRSRDKLYESGNAAAVASPLCGSLCITLNPLD